MATRLSVFKKSQIIDEAKTYLQVWLKLIERKAALGEVLDMKQIVSQRRFRCHVVTQAISGV
jgi:hypothetical protein